MLTWIGGLTDSRFCRRLCVFHNLINGTSPSYLLQGLPDHNPSSYALRSKPAVYQSAVHTERFQNSFFPFCISQWNALDCHIRNRPTICYFKRALFKFFKPSPASIFKVDLGIVLLTSFRVGFSHLREHIFNHNNMDMLDYLLQCPNHSTYRSTSFDSLHNMNLMFLPFNVSTLSKILIFGYLIFNVDDNQGILRAVINFILSTCRFDGSLAKITGSVYDKINSR